MAVNRDHELYTYPDQTNQNASSQYSTISPLHRVKCSVGGRTVINCLMIALLVCILVGVSYSSVKLSLDGGAMRAEVVPLENAPNLSTLSEQLTANMIHLTNLEQKIMRILTPIIQRGKILKFLSVAIKLF